MRARRASAAARLVVRDLEGLRLRAQTMGTRERERGKRGGTGRGERTHREDAAAAEGARLEAGDARLEGGGGRGAALLVRELPSRTTS